MGVISKTKTWADNENVAYTDLNADFDTLYNEFNGNIDNNNIKPGAGIDRTKIANTALTLTDIQTSTNKTFVEPVLQTPSIQTYDGWVSNLDTWTYASASTFTISGDETAVYTKGTRLRFKQGGAYKYAVVVDSAYDLTNTTVTIAINTDHVIANAAITANDYSYESNPQGYPTLFNFTVVPVGYSVAADVKGKYKVDGDLCTVLYWHGSGSGGTSNTTALAYNLPIVCATITGFLSYVAGRSFDNTGTEGIGIAQIASASPTISISKGANGVAWTASGGKYWEGQAVYPI